MRGIFLMNRTCTKHAKKFSLNSKTVLRWIRDEEKIRESKKGRKRVTFHRRSQFPELEEKLHEEYKDLRRKGLKVIKVHVDRLLVNRCSLHLFDDR